MTMWISRPALAATVALAALSARAQTTDTPRDVPTFGVETELVYVRFHVERKGGYVAELRRDHCASRGRPAADDRAPGDPFQR